MKKNICCGLGMALAFAAVAHAQDSYHKISKVGTEENQSFDILLDGKSATKAKKGDWPEVSPIVPDGKMFKGYTLYDKYGEKAEEQVITTTEIKEMRFLMPDHEVFVKASYESLRYYINAIKTEHGSVSYSFSDRMDIRDRTKPTFKVTVTPKADEGYKLSSIKVSKYLDAATTVTCAKAEAAAPAGPGMLPVASEGSCVFEMPNFDVDITATFVADSVDLPIVDLKDSKFRLKYELDGGKLPKDAAKSFACSEIAKLPTPTKEGFDFVGWSFENKLSNTYYALDRLDGTLCSDTTLYAIWTAAGTCMEQTAIAIEGDAKSPVCSSNIRCALIHSNKANQDSVCNGVVWISDTSILPSSSSVASSSSVTSSSSIASSSSEKASSSSSVVESSSSVVVESSSAAVSSSSKKHSSSSAKTESSSSEKHASSSSKTESSSSEKTSSSSSKDKSSSSATSASSSADVASSSSEKTSSSSSKEKSSSSETSASSSADVASSSSEKPASSSSKPESSSSETPASSSSKTESSSSAASQNTYYKITKVGTEENQSFTLVLNGTTVTEAKQGDWPEISPIVPEGKKYKSFTLYDEYGDTPEEQKERTTGKLGMRFLMPDHQVYVKVTYELDVASSSSAVGSSSAAKPSSSSTKIESSSAAKPASSSVKAESSSASKPASSSAKATSSSGKSEASSSSKAKSSSSVETVVEAVKTEDDLPNCTEKREGVTYYISDLKKIYICKDKKWTKFDPNGIPVVARAAMFSAVANGRSIQVSGAKVGSQVNLLDMQGRVVYSGKADAANFTMNLVRSGTFVLRIGTQQKVVNIR
jgi:hypothetical protein